MDFMPGVLVKLVADWGVMGLGWIGFFWSMLELKKARAAHDALVFKLVATVAKLELIERTKDGRDESTSIV